MDGNGPYQTVGNPGNVPEKGAFALFSCVAQKMMDSFPRETSASYEDYSCGPCHCRYLPERDRFGGAGPGAAAADATPGARGTSGVPLGSIDPAAAPGYRLQVVELTWEPGAYATRHFHPTALITCVQEGALGFVLQARRATLTRGGTADAPASRSRWRWTTEIVLEPRDCITFDEFAAHMEHTGWNAGDGSRSCGRPGCSIPSSPLPPTSTTWARRSLRLVGLTRRMPVTAMIEAVTGDHPAIPRR